MGLVNARALRRTDIVRLAVLELLRREGRLAA
jgi:hypothetical protein